MAETVKIGGELESTATGNVVAAASAIKDKVKNKYQGEINAETDIILAAHSSAINGLEGQNYVTLVATNTDADIAAVFTRLSVTPAVNTVYRIANWKHDDATTKYNVNYYSEYAANGNTTADLVPISVENKGIDDEPTAGSNNLVKSGGVYNALTIQENANSLIGDWVNPSDKTSYTAATGKNNGTFTAVTGGSIPTGGRPYFLTTNLVNGQKYRIRTKVTINSTVRNYVGLGYESSIGASWNALVGINGNAAIANSGQYIDVIFIADSSKNNITTTLDSLHQEDTVTFEEFEISHVIDINDYYESKSDAKIKYNDAKTNLNKVGFIGKGSTYSYTTYKNVLQAGHKYNFAVMTESWNMPEGVTSPTAYKFAIVIYNADGTERTRVADVKASGTVERNYSYTVPVNVNGLYFDVGGRIEEDTKVEVIFTDVTDVTALNIALNTTNSNLDSLTKEVNATEFLGWSKVFTKADANYKARLTSDGVESETGNTYKYIFAVNDLIRINAGIDESKYTIITAIHDTLEGAKANSNSTRHAFGGGSSRNTSPVNKSSYRFGDSTQDKGYLMVSIYKQDNSAITDAEIAEIESSLWLSFYPLNSTEKIQQISDSVKLKDNKTLYIDSSDFFTSNPDGVCVDSPVRAKFLKSIESNKLISVDISKALQNIPLLVWGAQIYNTLDSAMINSSGSVIQDLHSPWSTDAFIGNLVTNVSGYLNIFLKKSDNSAFTYSELIHLKEDIQISIRENEYLDYEEIPLGQFVRKGGTGEELEDSTTIVSVPYINCVPYLGVTCKFILPDDIQSRFVVGTSNSLGQTGYWKNNDEIITLATSQLIYRLQFKLKNGGELTSERIAKDYSLGLIKILHSNLDKTIKERNFDNEKYVKAAMYRLGWSTNTELSDYQGLQSMPLFAHISDLHGDNQRFKNCVEYAKYLGVDAIVGTGDNVLYNATNGSKFILDVLSKFSGIPFASCVGNHEVRPASTVTQEYLFNNFISPYITQGSYKKDANTVADNAYYYIDFTSKKIRLIVLNQYDNGCYFGEGLGGRLGQAQVSWLCNTLLSTPEGYGVIVAMHANEAKVNTPQNMSNWNQTVNWDGRSEDEYGYCANGLYVNSIRPIRTIIDAFISKDNNFSMTYQENTKNGNNGETVTISNIDFSSVASGVEFICYLTGHRHCDNIGYVNGAVNKQLMLNVVCGNPHYPRVSNLSFSEICDLPRGGRGATQDAFNVYAIDRQNGRVKVARIGSNVNFEGIERKFLIAPYRD